MKSNTLQAALCAPVHGTASAQPRSTSTKPAAPAPATIGATRLKDFCAKYRLSRWAYADMRRRGEGPDEFRIGVLVYISHAAEARWIAEREAASRVHRIER